MKYIPQTSLLSNIYVPFYELPKRVLLTGSDVSFEADENGMLSIINLSTDFEKRIPFIDFNKFDNDTRDWLWYNDVGLPFRFNYNTSNWLLESIYGIPSWSVNTSSLTIPLNFDRTASRELGIYTSVTVLSESKRLYKGVPLLIAVENIPLLDITDYINSDSTKTLTTINSNINKEFYYDKEHNRLVTNQNLAGFSPNDITIGFYTSINEVQVKCRLTSNEGTVSDVTPIVDYYILKMIGQKV